MKKKNTFVKKAAPWTIPLLIIFSWQGLSSLDLISERFLSSPAAILSAAYELTADGSLLRDVAVSLRRVLWGFFIGGSIGFLFGLFNGISKLSEALFDSTIQMVRNIPHLALIPLVILWFGIDEAAKIFLVALGTFFPIYINTYHGIRNVDASLVEMARVYELKGFALFRHVILQGALPSIFVGLRYAIGIAWITLIVAETIAAGSGIGYMAMTAREFMQLDIVLLSIILYALLGKLSDLIAKWCEQRFLRWNKVYQQ